MQSYSVAQIRTWIQDLNLAEWRIHDSNDKNMGSSVINSDDINESLRQFDYYLNGLIADGIYTVKARKFGTPHNTATLKSMLVNNNGSSMQTNQAAPAYQTPAFDIEAERAKIRAELQKEMAWQRLEKDMSTLKEMMGEIVEFLELKFDGNPKNDKQADDLFAGIKTGFENTVKDTANKKMQDLSKDLFS